MNFSFLNNLPQFGFGFFSNNMNSAVSTTTTTTTFTTTTTTKTKSMAGSITESSKQLGLFDFKIWRWSLVSFIPWVINSSNKFQIPTMNKRLKQNNNRVQGVIEQQQQPCGGCTVPLFRPYVAKTPWHKGARAFLSQFFPRYGHYCGPNWSSGKDNGSLLWDQRPIDWLDFCCYCHDIGYDTHDQAKLLKADLAFLECLERRGMNTKGDVHIARLYKTMCITGLRNILIPYRRQLVRAREGKSPIEGISVLSGKNNTYREA